MNRIWILANSLPRGGPFLLASSLDLLGYSRFAGKENVPRSLSYQFVKDALSRRAPGVDPHQADRTDAVPVSLFAPLYAAPETVRLWLTTAAPGEYLTGHMPWSASLAALLSELTYRQVVILRDPRALLLALLFEDEVMPRFLKADFAGLTPLEQVERMWLGGPLPGAGVTLQPFATVYRSLTAWADQADCLTVRFEELVSPQAGGERGCQQQALARLAAFLDAALDETALERLDQIDDPSSHTFSLAQRAAWPQRVGAEVAAYVEEMCAPLCDEAGYAR